MDRGPRIRADLEVVELDDGLVVCDPENDCVHDLNRVAAMVFLLCTGGHSADEIADWLGASFDLAIPPREDVHACLTQLGAARLLTNREEFDDA